MIEPNLPGLSVGKQCALLSISLSSFYYEPKGESDQNRGGPEISDQLLSCSD
jgi:putative transposase